MTATTMAVDQISAELARMDTDLYLFQPPDVEEKFFIDAALISGAAAVLCAGFLKGFMTGLKGHVEAIGQQAGDWVGSKLEALFRREQPVGEHEVDELAAQAAAMAAAADTQLTEQSIAETRAAIAAVFKQRRMLDANADAIAAAVEAAVRPLLATS